jgi:hypothetical protein
MSSNTDTSQQSANAIPASAPAPLYTSMITEQRGANATPPSAPVMASAAVPISTITVTGGGSTSASSVTETTLSPQPKSFYEEGATLKRNVNGKSDVWQFFHIYDEKKFQDHAFCLLCKSDIKYGKTHSTSNLEKHIQRHHKKEYEDIMIQRSNKRLKLLEDDSKSGNQNKITKFMDNTSNTESQECLIQWIIDAYLPLATVQRDTFRKYVYSLNKTAPIIGEDKIRSLLSNKYYDTQQQITNILKGQSVSLTTDAWTSIAKEGYVTCTLHFIEPATWTLHYFSLGIFKKDGTSTANDVVRYTEEHMTKFNITYPQLTCIVTDTEATMIAAGRIFKGKSIEAGGATAWHGCIDHKLELITKLAFKDIPESLGTMAACRAIVTFFNSSTQATEKLKGKTKARLGVALTVIQDVMTRWWSTYSMCERLLRLKTVLTVMHLEGDMRLFLSEQQWAIVSDMAALLKPFMIAQRLLEGQSYVTISLIPYILHKIRTGLQTANLEPSASAQVQAVSAMMLRKFNDEFGTGAENTVAIDHAAEGNNRREKGIPKMVLMAMCLDPRAKSGAGVPPADREVIWQYIEDELVEITMAAGPPTPTAPAAAVAPPPAMAPAIDIEDDSVNDVDIFFQDFDADDELQELNDALGPNDATRAEEEQVWGLETVRDTIQREMQLYKEARGMMLRDPNTKNFSNPLDWWRVNKQTYPHLSKLALKYLSIPATSAPSERVFSTAGLTIAKERARLDATRANEIVFLHDSIPALLNYQKTMGARNRE